MVHLSINSFWFMFSLPFYLHVLNYRLMMLLVYRVVNCLSLPGKKENHLCFMWSRLEKNSTSLNSVYLSIEPFRRRGYWLICCTYKISICWPKIKDFIVFIFTAFLPSTRFCYNVELCDSDISRIYSDILIIVFIFHPLLICCCLWKFVVHGATFLKKLHKKSVNLHCL